MNYRNDADKLLAALAGLVQDAGIALDDKGNGLAALNNIVFAFSFDAERQCLFIQSHAGSLREAADPAAVLEALLEANHLWQGTAGGVLGLDERNGELGLAYRLDFPLPGCQRFVKGVVGCPVGASTIMEVLQHHNTQARSIRKSDPLEYGEG